ncbi:MAG: Maf family protein [Turneriella sp.]|nr:Maf family protein [Turneriella sp.]
MILSLLRNLRNPPLLASSSPRRQEILRLLGVRCEIVPPHLDEKSVQHSDPHKRTLLLAEKKAEKVAQTGRLTIAADTVVVLDGTILEKPESRDEARDMLQRLSGRDHWVFTAVALIFPRGENWSFLEKTRVFFAPLENAVVEEYIATPAPYDKAGGYGVQDSFGMAFIHRIEGCYFNVMGFPASRFVRELAAHHRWLQD